jgi:predicted DNA-binding transcriptional regulator YafY
MGQTERVLRIQQLLRERPTISTRTFIEELEVSRAQLKRDLAFLRDRFRLQIDYVAKERAYKLTQANDSAEFALPGPMYTEREIHAMLVMQDLINQLQPGLLDEHLGPLRKRLKELLGREDLRSDEIRKRIRILHMASRPVQARRFSVVTQATLTRRRLRIRYHTRTRNEHTEREISPQRIVFYRGNWYLDAWCHLRQDLRSFAIDAIERATLLQKPAQELATEALDAHLGAGYGIFSGTAGEVAVLRFEPAAARYILAEKWHEKQVQILEASGHLVLQVPFSNEQELVMDILRYGPEVEVLAPRSLRHRVKVRLKDTLERYP